jgi:tellurite resistance protein TerC
VTVSRAIWLSVVWLAIGFLAGLPLLTFTEGDTAVSYWAVYVLERTLSLDNVFVFLLILGYFTLSGSHARRTVWWAIAGALVLRGVAILLGVELLERFSFIRYMLGALLLVFSVRMLRPEQRPFAPDANPLVGGIRRVVPLADDPDPSRFLTREGGRLAITRTGLALMAMVAADVTFAVDSIPAALGITHDPAPIWLANATALLGLIPLLVLVRALVRRFRYMRQTLAVVLALIGLRLLAESTVSVGPAASLAVIVLVLAVGVVISAIADRRDPPEPAEEAQRRPPRCPPAAVAPEAARFG